MKSTLLALLVLLLALVVLLLATPSPSRLPVARHAVVPIIRRTPALGMRHVGPSPPLHRRL